MTFDDSSVLVVNDRGECASYDERGTASAPVAVVSRTPSREQAILPSGVRVRLGIVDALLEQHVGDAIGKKRVPPAREDVLLRQPGTAKFTP